MLEIFLVFLIGLLPPLMSLWVVYQTGKRVRANLSATTEGLRVRAFPTVFIPSDRHYVEGVGYLIGDISCQFNARSAYIRCAVNPSGPCQDCFHYQPQDCT